MSFQLWEWKERHTKSRTNKGAKYWWWSFGQVSRHLLALGQIWAEPFVAGERVAVSVLVSSWMGVEGRLWWVGCMHIMMNLQLMGCLESEVCGKWWTCAFFYSAYAPCPLLSHMPQGKAISEEVQWIVVSMAPIIFEEEISMYTQISTRKVQQIVSYFKSHGNVCTPAHAWTKMHHALSDDHINVSLFGLYALILF